MEHLVVVRDATAVPLKRAEATVALTRSMRKGFHQNSNSSELWKQLADTECGDPFQAHYALQLLAWKHVLVAAFPPNVELYPTAQICCATIRAWLIPHACNWNPWVRVYQTLDKKDWVLDDVRVVKDIRTVLTTYFALDGKYDAALVTMVKLLLEQDEFSARFLQAHPLHEQFVLADEKQGFDERGDPIPSLRTRLLTRIEKMDGQEQNSIFLDVRRFAFGRVIMPNCGTQSEDAQRQNLRPSNIGMREDWFKCPYGTTHKTVMGVVGRLGLRVDPTMVSKETLAEEERQRVAKLRESRMLDVASEQEKKEHKAKDEPNVVDYLSLLAKWMGTKPMVYPALKVPSYAEKTTTGQNLLSFAAEMMRLSLFAYLFDNLNYLAAAQSFLTQYVVCEPDLFARHKRWDTKYFSQNDGCAEIRHAPFILICQPGFVVCSWDKRSKPTSSAIDAIEMWIKAVWSENKGVLHTGREMAAL